MAFSFSNFRLPSWLLQFAAVANSCPDIQSQLGPQLSGTGAVGTGSIPRWSEYAAPNPKYVVNVTTAEDVAATVKYLNQQNVSFVAQGGGSGNAATFDLGDCGVVINLAGLNDISFNADKTEATLGGGVTVAATVDAAWNNNVRIATATCNCLGFFGVGLGGGLARSGGLYGYNIDQLLSVEMVNAAGDLVHVDPTSDADLWWALKGAGPNFGIVTSAVVKTYPAPPAEDNVAWTGFLGFTDDQLETLIQTINDLQFTPEMQLDFAYMGTANGTTSIGAIPFYVGHESDAREAFKPLLDIGPVAEMVQEFTYNNWNSAADPQCQFGGYKPGYGLSTDNLDPTTWRNAYEAFKEFITANPGASNSVVFAEAYAVNSTAIRDGTGSFAWRNIKTHVVVWPVYFDSTLDMAANSWAREVRDILRSTDGIPGHGTYVNFAHGDEPLENIYGENLPKLQALKNKYDPQNRFNQWFDITGDKLIAL